MMMVDDDEINMCVKKTNDHFLFFSVVGERERDFVVEN